MAKKLIILVGLLCCFLYAGADNKEKTPAAPKPDELEMKYFQDQVGIGLEAEAIGNKSVKGEFIVFLEDSGSKITSQAAKEIGLAESVTPTITLKFNDKLSWKQPVRIEDFEPDWDFMFKESKRKVLGVLGLQGITDYQIALDFKNNKIGFIAIPKEVKTGKEEKPAPKKDNPKDKPKDKSDITEIKLEKGNKVKVLFNNGKVEAMLGFVTMGGKKKEQKTKDEKVIYTGVPIVITKDVAQKLGLPENTISTWPFEEKPAYYLNDINIGGALIKTAQIKILPDGFELNEKIDGFIGPAFLEDYKAVFDFQQKKLFLEKHPVEKTK